MAMSAETPILPTTTHRARSLDVLRGIAILGILLANIWGFSDPSLVEMLGIKVEYTALETQIQAWTGFLVSGKFRSLLCLLFGAGLCLHLTKRVNAQQPIGRAYRRYFLLGFIGALHGIFIWWGDILFSYACAALLVIAMLAGTQREKMSRLLKGWVLAAVAAGLAMMLLSSGPGMSMKDLGDFATYVSPSAETRVFGAGFYGEQLIYRAIFFFGMAVSLLMLLPTLIALFLTGFMLADKGAFTDPESHRQLWQKLQRIGLGVGIPLNALSLWVTPTAFGTGYHVFIEMIAAPILSIGILATLMLACACGVPRWLSPIENVGKLALTNYLLQSVICTTIYYSYGGRLFGKLEPAQDLAIVVCVWGANLLFSAVWLRYFAVGPVEAWWRSMAERSPIRMRREAAQQAT